MSCPFLKWHAEVVRSIALHTLAQLIDTNQFNSGPNICLSELEKDMLYLLSGSGFKTVLVLKFRSYQSAAQAVGLWPS